MVSSRMDTMVVNQVPHYGLVNVTGDFVISRSF